jgi:D-amino-acid dehydrogenase
VPVGSGHRIVVIGGGVVGLCCAIELQRDGFAVTIVERDPPGESAAAASCGYIAVSEVIPLSKPGILLKAPGWLIDPTGPLSLRPASLVGILPWFLRFVGNARPRRIRDISAALARLTTTALGDYEALLKLLGLTGLIGETPVLELYDSPAELAHEQPYLRARRDLGFRIDEISGAEAAEMEPALAKDFAGAAVYRDWRSIVDGRRFVTALSDGFVAKGGTWVRVAAVGFLRDDHRITAVRLSDGRELPADQAVIAAGAWSKRLASEVGMKIMVEGVIGYQTTIADPGVDMAHAVIYAKGGFGITPYESGLAISGSIEFATLAAEPDWRRADTLVEKAKRVLPGLKTADGTRRIGRRPFTPDTLPIIDRSPTVPNVLIATGHGQLGVTLGATTGKLISHLAAGRATDIDLSPYSATRF